MKSIKNEQNLNLEPSRTPLNASLFNLITKMVPKDPQMIENCHLVTLNLGLPRSCQGQFCSRIHLLVEGLQVSNLRGHPN